VRLLQLLVIAILPYSVNTLFIALLRVTVRPRRIVVIQASLAGLILGFTVLLIRPFGLEGVGMAFLAGQSIVAAVVLATSLRPLLVRAPAKSYASDP
jgi:O-antigen/teichoic acid export membrane protein